MPTELKIDYSFQSCKQNYLTLVNEQNILFLSSHYRYPLKSFIILDFHPYFSAPRYIASTSGPEMDQTKPNNSFDAEASLPDFQHSTPATSERTQLAISTDEVATAETEKSVITYEDALFPDYVNNALIYGMPSIMAIGIGGNALSFVAIVASKTRKISTGVYLSVLAWFDSLSLVLWTSLFWSIPYLGAPFAGLLRKCNIFNFLMTGCSSYCSMCVVCVTTDRFIAVFFPLTAKRFTTRKRAALVLASLAAVMVACFGPALISTKEFCGSNGLLDVYADTVMYLLANIFYSHGPIIYLLCLNIAIAAKLCINQKLFSKNRSRISTNDEKVPKAVVTVLVVSVVYVILILPYNLLMILVTSANFQIANKGVEEIVVTICRLMMVSNHGVNFFLYTLTSVEFRRTLLNFICYPIAVVRTRLDSQGSSTSVTGI